MFLDRRFADAQRVDAVSNSLNCLRDRPVLHVGQARRLHGQVPGIVRRAVNVVLRQSIAHDGDQIRARGWLNPLQHNAIGIVLLVRLADVRVVNLRLTQLLFQRFDCILRDNVDGVVYLHLQDQVRSTLQIEAQVDVVGQGGEQSLTRKALHPAALLALQLGRLVIQPQQCRAGRDRLVLFDKHLGHPAWL